jgi:23S rRNA (pseudouridine1915-N3)-methyltransferase
MGSGMRITILCIGRIRSGPAAALYEDYAKRVPWPITLKEFVQRRPLPVAERIAREASMLQSAIPNGAVTVALDERGKGLASAEFAKQLRRWIDQARSDIAFLIGGADGLAPEVKQAADLVLSLGPMTWPHALVRALLAEQLYRAHTIMTGHPYHRG